MGYILTLCLIVLASSSQIINKDDEIKEFAEYEDVELQFLYSIIPYFEKGCIAAISLCDKARSLAISTRKFKNVNGTKVIAPKIFKDRKLFIKQYPLFRNKHILRIENKTIACKQYNGLIKNSSIDKKVSTIDKFKLNEIYRNYQKIKEVYNKCKDIYLKGKESYLKIGMTLKKQQEYQKLEQNRTQAEQQKLKLQKIQAFKRYFLLKNNNTMTLDEKQ